jgi:hypothetical protein
MDNSAALPKNDLDVDGEVMEEVQSAVEEQDAVSEVSEVSAVEEHIDENDVEEVVPHESNPLIREMSVQAAPTESADDSMSYIELGDRVVFYSKYGKTLGTVYYRSHEMISIKPDGSSNRLQQFEFEEVDDENDVEIYKEEYGVTFAAVIEKRTTESFVEQQDLRVNLLIDTFDTSGDPVSSYIITAVNTDKDMITIREVDPNTEEGIVFKSDTKDDIIFNFIGIQPDEDFAIISVRQFVDPKNQKQVSNEDEEQQEEQQEEQEEEQEEEEEEEEGIQLEGFIKLTRAKVFREATSYEQRIPDSLQKIDALNDFMSGLDPTLQKDPKALRAIRILVETLFDLKQSTIAYRDDHSIQGTRNISARNIADLIERTTVPLGRPVLRVTKKVYKSDDSKEVEPDELSFLSFEDELIQMKQYNDKLVSTILSGAQSTVVRVWSQQQAFNKTFLSPCIFEQEEEPLWQAFSDSEYFRSEPPSSTEEEGVITLVNTVAGYVAPRVKDVDPILDKVPFGLERALSTTYRKGEQQRKKQVLSAEESATIESYVMFPLSVAKYLGSTRSRYIITDSGRSQMPTKTMKMILEERGAPQEPGTSKDIILLNVLGTSIGNIPLADYIDGMTVPALGLGDTFDTLEQYGMEHLELNRDIAQVLLNKIEKYQSQLLSTLSELRKANRELIATEPILNPFLNPIILEEIRSLPTLAEALAEYERINPSLRTSDIGQVLYLLRHYPILFQVAAGKNAVLLGSAKIYTRMTNYLEWRHINHTNQYNEKNKGEKPERNTCQHIGMLVTIRKIINNSDRFQQLTTFFKKYQGARDKDLHNWINCNKCKKHLLCVHEILQLQAYLNPKEKDTLEKEIILKCSGGQFQGKYICRNCGQPIRELDFDNGLEFDDNGKPKSGRSVLVDEDAIFDEKLKGLLSNIDDSHENDELQSDEDIVGDVNKELKKTNMKFYNIIREIVEQVGIQVDDAGYRSIIMRVIAYISKFPSEEVYLKIRKFRVDYQVELARDTIAACGIFLLIEIQTKKPSYVLRYPLLGCSSPGFDGYPLNSDPNNRQGIEYIACAISSITRKEPPWNQSGFQATPDAVKRQAVIVLYMNSILDGGKKAPGVISDAMIQYELAEKRTYLLERLEASSSVNDARPKDMIPLTFLPEQIIVTPEQAAKDAIRPDVAANMGNKGKMALVKLWIRRAHELAKETAPLIRGSPLMEITCCLSTIIRPGIFFMENMDMPPIGRRVLQPYQQGQFMLTEFIPRPTGTDVVSADKDLYYRIFLKCCYQGVRMGYSHEPGLTHFCHWCEFKFPTHPAVMDTDTEGKSALATQGVETTTDAFINLLDTIHNVNKVEPVEIKEITSVTDIMRALGEVVPQPIAGWSDIVKKTTDEFLKLPPLASRSDVVLAAGMMSEATNESEQIIRDRLKLEIIQETMKGITRLSWMNFFQVMQTYFITPFQRLISQFDKKSLSIPMELVKALSESHVTDDLQPMINKDMLLLSMKGVTDIMKSDMNLARAKLQHYINQMRVLLPFKNSIRSTVVPGRQITLEYIQRALFYGPLSTLIHSAEIPEGAVLKSAVKNVNNPSMKFILEVVAFTLQKYNTEKLSYDDKEIKNMIEIRAEKERVNVLAKFNSLSDEERRIERTNMRLGMGQWAVGGTKLIYAYDKEYYDQERHKRMAAGISDFPGQEDSKGRAVDEFGFDENNDEYNDGEDDGYDFNQHGDDDE